MKLVQLPRDALLKPLQAVTGIVERLVRMGEEPPRIHVTGAPGLDDLLGQAVMPRAECLAALGLPADAAIALSLAKRVRELGYGIPALLSWQWTETRRLLQR